MSKDNYTVELSLTPHEADILSQILVRGVDWGKGAKEVSKVAENVFIALAPVAKVGVQRYAPDCCFSYPIWSKI